VCKSPCHPSVSTTESETPGNESTEKEPSWRIRDRWLFDADDEHPALAMMRAFRRIEFL
jgi:hypothetical protein